MNSIVEKMIQELPAKETMLDALLYAKKSIRDVIKDFTEKLRSLEVDPEEAKISVVRLRVEPVMRPPGLKPRYGDPKLLAEEAIFLVKMHYGEEWVAKNPGRLVFPGEQREFIGKAVVVTSNYGHPRNAGVYVSLDWTISFRIGDKEGVFRVEEWTGNSIVDIPEISVDEAVRIVEHYISKLGPEEDKGVERSIDRIIDELMGIESRREKVEDLGSKLRVVMETNRYIVRAIIGKYSGKLLHIRVEVKEDEAVRIAERNIPPGSQIIGKYRIEDEYIFFYKTLDELIALHVDARTGKVSRRKSYPSIDAIDEKVRETVRGLYSISLGTLSSWEIIQGRFIVMKYTGGDAEATVSYDLESSNTTLSDLKLTASGAKIIVASKTGKKCIEAKYAPDKGGYIVSAVDDLYQYTFLVDLSGRKIEQLDYMVKAEVAVEKARRIAEKYGFKKVRVGEAKLVDYGWLVSVDSGLWRLDVHVDKDTGEILMAKHILVKERLNKILQKHFGEDEVDIVKVVKVGDDATRLYVKALCNQGSTAIYAMVDTYSGEVLKSNKTSLTGIIVGKIREKMLDSEYKVA